MRILTHILTALIGAVILYSFFWPSITEKIEVVESVKTDTVYIEHRDSIFIPVERLVYEHVRDTVIMERNYPINRYKGLEATLFGDIGYNALVAGKMLNLTLTPNFSVPKVTNTINRTETRTFIKRPKGLYGVGGVGSDFNYSVGAIYLNDKSLFGYNYQPQTGIHSISAGFKLF